MMRSRKTFGLAAVAAIVLATASYVPAAFSQEGEGAQQQTRKTPAMREKVYTKLAEAQTLAEADNMAGARRLLDQVRNMSDLNSYETAQMWNFYAFIYYSQGNENEALAAYERVLQQPDLPIGLENTTIFTLAQLYAANDQYRKSNDMLNRWFRTAENPGPEPFILQAQNYYQLEQYRQGIQPAERAISVAQAQGKAVKEQWYMLLNVLYYQLEDYRKVREILEILAASWPKKEYFTQLAAVYGELDMETRQIGIYEAAYEAGWLESGSEIVRLAQLLMQSEVPYKAAKVLEKGLNDGAVESKSSNWRLLSQAWTLAQEDEKAIPALQQAARMSSDGDLDIRLAQSYLNLDRYDPCVDSAREALNKGGLRRRDTANVILGMCLYELKRYNEARQAFRTASQDSRSAATARNWLAFIDRELDRQRQLRDAMAPVSTAQAN